MGSNSGNTMAIVLIVAFALAAGIHWYTTDLARKTHELCVECQREEEQENPPSYEILHTVTPNGREVYCVLIARGNFVREPWLTCDWGDADHHYTENGSVLTNRIE